MRFALTEEQQTFRDAARVLLARECPPEVVRAAWPAQPESSRSGQGAGAGSRADPARLERLWSELAAMGVLGLLVPEDAGGLGLDEVAAAVVWEETGYAAVPFGVVEISGVVAPLLAEAGADHGELLAEVLTGTERPAALAPGASTVPWFDAATTHHVVVFEKDEAWNAGTARNAGMAVAIARIQAAAGGSAPATSTARSVVGLDGARRLAEVRVDRTTPLAGVDAEVAMQRGALGTAAQLVGLAQRMLDLTVAYVIERRQYGVAIGSFQAIKHQLADVRLQLEFVRPALLGAAWALATRQPTAARDVSMAKAMASDCARLAARKALQCHGAIGHTVEYDLHLYVKRAWALASTWGDVAQHRDTVAEAIGL